jgi:hypothetical protein
MRLPFGWPVIPATPVVPTPGSTTRSMTLLIMVVATAAGRITAGLTVDAMVAGDIINTTNGGLKMNVPSI